MGKTKPRRKKILQKVETAVLAQSARRCTLCFLLMGDLREKIGQIAHLDGDPSNRAEDNLAWMCLDHHSLYDSKTKQHKNYTIDEVQGARARLYEQVDAGKHLTPATVQPYGQVNADTKILRDLLEVVPSNGTIDLLRTYNFGFSFCHEELNDIRRFVYKRDGPDHEFLDSELEAARSKFRSSCDIFLRALGKYTFPTHLPGYGAIPEEWELDNPKLFDQAVEELNAGADAICATYDELVRLARKKLAM